MNAVLINSLARGGAEKVGLTTLMESNYKGIDTLLIIVEREKGYAQPEGYRVIYLTNFEKLENPLIKIFWVFICAYRLKKIIKKEDIKLVQSHLSRANFINVGASFLGAEHITQIVTHKQITFKEFFPVNHLKKWLFSKFYNRADQVISISKMMKRKMDNLLSVNSDKHTVVYNPHNINQIMRLSEEVPGDFQFDPDKKYLISAGRLFKGKRIEDIIQAFSIIRKEHQDVELIILGEGVSLPSLIELSEQLGLEKTVHFLGYKTNPFSYISRSYLFLLASESEGLPNIIIESLACRTPVISSDCISGPREILSPQSDFSVQLKEDVEFAEFGILYPVGNILGLSKSIIKMLDDRSLYQTYKESSQIRADHFDQSNIVEQYFRSPKQEVNQFAFNKLLKE